jgi:hypothetical protein
MLILKKETFEIMRVERKKNPYDSLDDEDETISKLEKEMLEIEDEKK